MTTEYNQSSDTTILEEIQSLITSNHHLANLTQGHLNAVGVGLLGPFPVNPGYTKADDSSTDGILGAIRSDLRETRYRLAVLAEDSYYLRRCLLPAERETGG